MIEIDPKYQGKINRMRNLPLYADKSDEEIYEHLLRKEEDKKGKIGSRENSDTYVVKYNKLIDALKAEYGVDMNDSNDAEALKNLVRQMLQLEALDKQITGLQENPSINWDDSRVLKNLSDIQRNLTMSISDLQRDLGVSRKERKGKQADDIPQWIAGLKKKAGDFFERQTVKVMCEKDEIELYRYWVNFPKRKVRVTLELECPKCQEIITFAR